jgi:hypothetical protein
MKIYEITQNIDRDVEEAKPTRSYCRSTPKNQMSASWKASCKSRGTVSRDGDKSHKVGKKRIKVGGKKIRGKDYGGPLPDWSDIQYDDPTIKG